MTKIPRLLSRLSPCLVLGLFSAALGCGPGPSEPDAGPPPPPSAAGAWKGTYECNAGLFKLSAALAQNEDGIVDGEMFLDYQIVLLGQPFTLTGRANVEDASADEGEIGGHLDVIDNSQGLPDYDFALTLNEDEDELNGELSRTNGNGDVVTCPVSLDRTPVTDEPADEPNDGGS